MPSTRIFHLLKTRPEIFLAVAATIVSVCALGATLYQTILMRQQQHAGVWPRLQLLHGWSRESASPFYRLTIENVGIGPAIIRKVSIKHRNKSYKDFARLASAIARQHNVGDSLAYQNYADLLPDMVIPQQQELELLFITKEPYLLHFVNEINAMQVEVQYESLYGEAWKVTYPKITHQEAY
jgi:hypothetical protein